MVRMRWWYFQGLIDASDDQDLKEVYQIDLGFRGVEIADVAIQFADRSSLNAWTILSTGTKLVFQVASVVDFEIMDGRGSLFMLFIK